MLPDNFFTVLHFILVLKFPAFLLNHHHLKIVKDSKKKSRNVKNFQVNIFSFKVLL